LRAWLKSNQTNPNPSEQEIQKLAQASSLTPKQVKVWFYNERHKLKKLENADSLIVKKYNTKFSGVPSIEDVLQNGSSSNEKFATESRGKKLDPEGVKILRAWLKANRQDPHPTEEDVQKLIKLTNFTTKQIKVWFYNERHKLKKIASADADAIKKYERKFLNLPDINELFKNLANGK